MTDVDRPHLTDAPEHGLTAATDPELITRVRAGDTDAYEELFRRHRDVAIRYARRIAGAGRAEDLCAEAFAKILDLLQRGKGPDVAFRAYLLTTVRTSHINEIRVGSREELVPDHEPISRMVPVTEDPDARFDREAIHRAFSELPERWRAALWLTAVEGLSNEEVGVRLGIGQNAVASLAFRARSGLRQAFLAEHLQDTEDPQCRRIVELLPSHLRGTLTPRRRKQVDAHLETCATCTAAAVELGEVDTRLGALLAPLAMTGFAAGGAALVPLKSAVILGAAKAKVAAAIGHAKGWGTGVPAATGVKVAVIAAVAALGVGAGASALSPSAHHPKRDPEALTSAPPAVPAPSRPPTARVQVLPPASSPVAVAPWSPPSPPPPRTPDAPTGAQHHPPRSHPPSPASKPAGTPTSTPATPTPRLMAIGQQSTTRFQRTLMRWNRVTVPVTNPVAGAALELTSTRTLNAALVIADNTGWICGTPVLTWNDGHPFATSVTECRYNGHGDGSPLRIEYQVGGGALLSSQLTPPAGFLDTSPLDNLAVLNLLA